jgi:ribonucleoside-diphosphate reductase alpha chain
MLGKFKTSFSHDIFHSKYAMTQNETWEDRCNIMVNDVCGDRSLTAKDTTQYLMSPSDQAELAQYMIDMKFIPGGRYIYYSGRPAGFFNNCFVLKAEEDTREEWARLSAAATSCLMSGGGIGVDYSILRPSGRFLNRTGGISSGPIPLMHIINEIGRNVMQGGSRRSAIYGSLNWQHEDIMHFLSIKDWEAHHKERKLLDFNHAAPLDMTNISINWDTAFIEKFCKGYGNHHVRYDSLDGELPYENIPQLWYDSVRKMCETGEPGHSYNFWENENDTGRNACTEFTSEDDSDVCNLGSINMGNISSIDELRDVVSLASKFLVCGTLRAELPYDKVKLVREKNRKIGLGLMGVHEWLLQRGYDYEMVGELKEWLEIYKAESEASANEHCDRFYISRPKKYRAIAPAGTIGILASTTTGIEPLYAVSYKRRYLEGGTRWKYQYVIDSTAQQLIDTYGLNPEEIQTAASLAYSPEQRIKFQYEVQKYVDMAISSTLNLPAWGTEHNNETTCSNLANTLLKYCHGLRGVTVYPDGSRGGQPLTTVPYEEAVKHKGIVFAEENSCSGGVCGI